MATLDAVINSFTVPLEAPVRDHLKSVYACLCMSVISASVGAYTHIFTSFLSGFNLLFGLVGLGLGLALHSTPDTGKNRGQRLALLLAFAFLSGLGTGPLINMALNMNESLVATAFLMTAVVFASFSAAAIFAPAGHYLQLGGLLMSGVNVLLMLGLANIFFRSNLLFQAHIWLGLAVFCGFVVFDTQLIVEKRRRGDKDFIGHALDLFIDFVQIFRKVLIILMQKEENNGRKKRR